MKIKSLEELKPLFAMAEEYKDDIKNLYAEAMKYVMPNADFNSETFSEIKKADAVYDTLAMVESDKLSRKIVNMVLPTSMQWGTLTSNGKMTNKNKLDTYGESIYKNIITSNLNKEALSFFNCLNIGTSVMRLNFTEDPSNPFKFDTLALNGLFFLEDKDGSPKIAFYKHFEIPNYIVNEKYGLSLESKEINYIECCYEYGEGKDLKTHYIVCNENFTEIYFENKDMGYFPLIICRGEKYSNNIWGIGPAIKALPNIVNNNETVYNIKLNTHAKQKPPLFFEGMKEDFKNFNFALGKLNYLGNANTNRISNLPNMSDLNPALMDSEKDRQAIRDIFFSSYITKDLGNGNPRTAYEWQQRYREFLEVFSPNYEMIEGEFLKPIFENCLKILILEEIDGINKEDIKTMEFKPKFKNKLTENYTQEKIQNFNNYISNIANIVGNPQIVIGVLKPDVLIKKYAEWYDIDMSLIKKPEEINQIIGQYLNATLNEQGGVSQGQPQQPEEII